MSFQVPTGIQPTLAEGEMALQLDDGTLVAVLVVPSWLPNGMGVSFRSAARHIDPDGITRQDGHGLDVRTEFCHTTDALSAGTAGQVSAIAKELILAMLGEAPTMRSVEGGEAPVLALSDEMRANVNIRRQIAVAGVTGPTAIDPAEVLGL